MSGSVYGITPSLGLAFWQTYPTTAPVGGTGPQFPTPGMQYGMQPGKVVRGSDSNKYMLVTSGATALTANQTINIGGPPNFIVGGTGGIAGTAPIAVPANSLFWANVGF